MSIKSYIIQLNEAESRCLVLSDELRESDKCRKVAEVSRDDVRRQLEEREKELKDAMRRIHKLNEQVSFH